MCRDVDEGHLYLLLQCIIRQLVLRRERTHFHQSHYTLIMVMVRNGRSTSIPYPAGVVMDVISRRNTGEAMNLCDKALASTSEAIIITDPNLPDNPIIYCNQGFEALTGLLHSSLPFILPPCH